MHLGNWGSIKNAYKMHITSPKKYLAFLWLPKTEHLLNHCLRAFKSYYISHYIQTTTNFECSERNITPNNKLLQKSEHHHYFFNWLICFGVSGSIVICCLQIVSIQTVLTWPTGHFCLGNFILERAISCPWIGYVARALARTIISLQINISVG